MENEKKENERGAGRKKIMEDSVHLSIIMERSEYETVRDLAKEQGKTVSVYVRETLSKALQQEELVKGYSSYTEVNNRLDNLEYLVNKIIRYIETPKL